MENTHHKSSLFVSGAAGFLFGEGLFKIMLGLSASQPILFGVGVVQLLLGGKIFYDNSTLFRKPE